MEAIMATTRTALLAKLSEILEAQVTETTDLLSTSLWDSMSIVMVVAEIDSICGREVDGVAISKAKTVADLMALAGL